MLARARMGQALAYVRAAEPRVPLSRRAFVTDILIAVVALAGSLLLVKNGDHAGLTVTSGGVVAQPASSTANAVSGNRLRKASGTEVSRMARAECFHSWPSD